MSEIEQGKDNSLRATLEAQFDEHIKEEPVDNTPITQQDVDDKRERDEKGRFLSKEKDEPKDNVQVESKPVESKPVEAKAAETPDKPVDDVSAAEEKPVETRKAPSSWKKAEQEAYSNLDPSIQDIIDRREADFHKGLESYREKATRADEWSDAVSPYMATINQFGVTPQAAVGELLKADHALRYGNDQQKAAMAAKVLTDYGINLEHLNAALSGQTQFVDPTISNLQTQFEQLQQHLQQQEMMKEQQEADAIRSQLESLAPEMPLLDEARETMAQLLESGLATDFRDAYEKATRIEPALADRLAATQRQTQEQAKRDEEKRIAEAARQKSVSVTGSPAGGTPLVQKSQGSLRADLEANWDKVMGGGRI